MKTSIRKTGGLKTKRVNLWFGRHEKRELQAKAKAAGKSLSGYLRGLGEAELARPEPWTFRPSKEVYLLINNAVNKLRRKLKRKGITPPSRNVLISQVINEVLRVQFAELIAKMQSAQPHNQTLCQS